MATEKIGVYRRWLEPIPKENGKAVPQKLWPAKRRHSWSVRWFGTDGKRYSKSFSTRKEADRFARQLQQKVLDGKQDKPKEITLGQFRQEHLRLMRGQVAYATLWDQDRALRLFENFIGSSVKLAQIKPIQAEAFVSERLSSGVAPTTANKDIRALKRIFNLAIEPRGYLSEKQNPFGKIKLRKTTPKPIRYISVEEYRHLLSSADNLWWQAFISLGYVCGLRKREIENLTWSDIDFENQLVFISAKQATEYVFGWEPKDHENRQVPLPEKISRILANLQAESSEGSCYIFISPERVERIQQRIADNRWHGMSEILNNVLRDFDTIRKRANIPKCTLHDLRRSAITNWAKHLPIQVVQQLAGHSDITTTRNYYLSVRNEDIDLARTSIGSMLAGQNSD